MSLSTSDLVLFPDVPRKMINGKWKVVHHKRKGRWYLTFVERYCNNCKMMVPTVVVEWMHCWIRCYYCLMKPDMQLPIIKERNAKFSFVKKQEPSMEKSLLRNGVYEY